MAEQLDNSKRNLLYEYARIIVNCRTRFSSVVMGKIGKNPMERSRNILYLIRFVFKDLEGIQDIEEAKKRADDIFKKDCLTQVIRGGFYIPTETDVHSVVNYLYLVDLCYSDISLDEDSGFVDLIRFTINSPYARTTLKEKLIRECPSLDLSKK